MKQVLWYSVLLVVGLLGSQGLPTWTGSLYYVLNDGIRVLSMVCLSFIMIRVGYEFDLDKTNLRQYAWDYVVAFTAASFPWLFVAVYFVYVMLPADLWHYWGAWKETLLAARFAAPTSAGVLFAMLLASGLGATWLFRKARILAIFDDLDTVLLMIPLKMLIVGWAWQLGLAIFVMAAFVIIAYVFLHRIPLPISWPWVLTYACLITAFSEVIYQYSKLVDPTVPMHIEVLLPAFVLGCIIAYPESEKHHSEVTGGHHPEIETPQEKLVAMAISGFFMVLVGLSMPVIIVAPPADLEKHGSSVVAETLQPAGAPAALAEVARIGQETSVGRVTSSQPPLGWSAIVMHVIAVTVLANLGKMFPALCYRREAHWRERLAVAIGMWPRGEVGAGVLVISMSYGIGGPIVTVALLSLALNLLLTGFYIYLVKRLTRDLPTYRNAS
ncbi:MAG: hypothetical protein RMJ82_12950 [Gemmatales bacterium]|nr:hypothetical protein [Gemmatales bacterium]